MVHADFLEELKTRFYQYGLGTVPMSQEDAKIFQSLDQWQRLEVLNSMKKGADDLERK